MARTPVTVYRRKNCDLLQSIPLDERWYFIAFFHIVEEDWLHFFGLDLVHISLTSYNEQQLVVRISLYF
jgi:hypothetical protein